MAQSTLFPLPKQRARRAANPSLLVVNAPEDRLTVAYAGSPEKAGATGQWFTFSRRYAQQVRRGPVHEVELQPLRMLKTQTKAGAKILRQVAARAKSQRQTDEILRRMGYDAISYLGLLEFYVINPDRVVHQAYALAANPRRRGSKARAGAARLPAHLRKYAHLPGFQAALDRYVKFHGVMPVEVSEHTVPMGRADEVVVMVGMGEAPSESYAPSGKYKGSNKRGSVWVHKYKGRGPMKCCDASGKVIITLPGKHKVTDWIRG